MERLGMGMNRLGFGQVGGSKAAAAPKKMGGFGSVSKPAQDDGEKFAREKFGTQKGISSDEFFGRGTFDPQASAEAKSRLSGMCHVPTLHRIPVHLSLHGHVFSEC